MSQYDVIMKAMINNPQKREWTAKDFQKGPFFVGYEATARMSELAKKYDDLIIVGKEGRFRTIAINWNSPYIKEYIEIWR